jgi:uncharacterized phage protein (TIGR01671 family)
MREIKFRAWNLTDKCWDVPKTEYSIRKGAGDLFHREKENIRFNRGDIVLMQFTGEKDKNGSEIFEGDIIKGNQGNFRVLFEGGRFVVAFPKGATVQNLHTFLLSNNEKEIIGNVYDNLESWSKE